LTASRGRGTSFNNVSENLSKATFSNGCLVMRLDEAKSYQSRSRADGGQKEIGMNGS
jgi:hypothetical protein